jgi:hypothetical protein
LCLGHQLVVGEKGLANSAFEGIIFTFSGQFNPVDSPLGYVDIQSGWFQHTANPRSKYWGYDLLPIPSALEFSQARAVHISNCTFHHMGASALAFGPGSQFCTVSHSSFLDISGTAISLGGIYDESEIDLSLQSANLSISDCKISEAAVEWHSAAGIFIGFSRGTQVLHNRLRNLSYSAVSLSW